MKHNSWCLLIFTLGEGKEVRYELMAPWKETTLPTLSYNHDLSDIHNADEFGLFYKALPNKSLHFKKQKYVGGKHRKTKLTGLAAASAAGEKLLMFVIGK